MPVNLNGGAYTMNCLPDSNCQSNTVDASPSILTRHERGGTGAPMFLGPNPWNKVIVALILWISFFAMEARAQVPQNVPSGTIELSGGSIAAGVGYTWGSGALIFQGKKYDLDVSGISLLNVGASSYTASGSVYNLKKLSDFNGVYTAASPRSSITESSQTIAIKNPNGVLIQMATTNAGFAFSLGPNGVTISVK
jgi:hypothetical protein